MQSVDSLQLCPGNPEKASWAALSARSRGPPQAGGARAECHRCTTRKLAHADRDSEAPQHRRVRRTGAEVVRYGSEAALVQMARSDRLG